MPVPDDLQQQIAQLRAQLTEHPELPEDERSQLQDLLERLETEALLENTGATADPNLIDGVNMAVEQFEARHPTLTGTLRNILVHLGNIGI